MRTPPEMQSAWTDYWKNGPTESLPGDRASGLLGALDSAWAEFFLGLPNGAKILDLATGGADVVRHAANCGRDFDITGVDIADLSAVSATLQSDRIRFVGNTDLSSLPFQNTSFDAVVSQFGFEYADIAAASSEALRVLVPQGRGLFILHRSDSAITQGSVNSLAAYVAVFPDNSAFHAGRHVFLLYQRCAAHTEIAAAEDLFRATIRASQSRLRNDRAFAIAGNVVEFLGRLAADPASCPAREALHRLEAVEKANEARNLRKRAQIDAALDRNGVERLASLLKGMGAAVQPPNELRYSAGRPLAWSLLFRK